MHVREASADDYDAYARLFVELGTGESPAARERFASELVGRVLVTTDDGAVTGYLLLEEMQGVGYIRNVVSDPTRRRAGVGVALMTAARDRFVAAGATTWCLNVKAENRAAIGLYEKLGMGVHYRTTVMRLPREVELPAPDPALALEEAPFQTDALLEPKFRLLPGQLASARKKSGRFVAQLVRGSDVLGLGVFMASVPGSFPFRVAPEHAAAFLALLRRHVPDSATFLQVGAEDDDALALEVQRLGARVHLELLHMHGPLA